MNTEDAKALVEYFNTSIDKSTSSSFLQVFSNSMLTNLKYFLSYYILAMSVYTVWLNIVGGAVKGFGIGFTTAFLIFNYSTHGIVYVILAIVPSMVISVSLLSFASVVCINFAYGRRKRGEVGMKSALCIIPALGIIYCTMSLSCVYDGLIAPLIFKSLF